MKILENFDTIKSTQRNALTRLKKIVGQAGSVNHYVHQP
jgi:hypothetical protein